MRRVVVIFTLFLVSAIGAKPDVSQMPASFDVDPRLERAGTECDGASSGTIVCSYNCTEVLLCRGDAEPIELETCIYPFGCLDGVCVNGTSSCSSQDTYISCTGRGIFPDPYDCTKYHICKGENYVSRSETCDHGWAYDPLAYVCSKQLTDSICEKLPILCRQLGETGVFPGNPSIYYVCVIDEYGEFLPELFRCPHGGIYNPSTFLCSDGPPSSSARPTSSSTRPETTPAPTPNPSSPFSCSTPMEVVPDPSDCSGYYECLPTYLWMHVDCSDGFYFDRDRQLCLYGPCPYSL